MRSLPKVLAARPNCQVLIVGGDDVSYGARLPEGETYRQKMPHLGVLNALVARDRRIPIPAIRAAI